jgi:hypothetical protein
MRNHPFKIGSSIYMIVIFIFIFGVFLEITQTDFILKTYKNNASLNVIKKQSELIKIPEKTLADIEQEPFLIIYDPLVQESIAIKDNFQQTLKYMKQKTEEATVEAIPVNLDSYKMVILTFEDIDQISDINQIESYVDNGGKFFFAIRPDMDRAFYKLYRKLGIYEAGTFVDAKGIELTSNILINRKGLKVKDMLNSSIFISLDERSTIYAKAFSSDLPLLWDVKYGKGKFMVFNGTMLSAKDSRGFVAGAISLLQEDFMYPILNMKIAYLDDFPAPVPQGYNEKIFNELKLDIPTFYRNVWWPFIQRQSAKYNLKYTGVVIETYNNKVTTPFDSEHETENHLVTYGRELLKMGGEIGVHGYNHQSLVTTQSRVNHLDYRAWPNVENMVSALIQVRSHINQTFPGYTLATYVPPSNIMDEDGVQALLNAIPTISNISSIYIPDDEMKAFVQEFEVKGNIIHLPRISSGHDFSPYSQWSISNGITSIGVFSHFIHPDDILDENRGSTYSWREMSEGLNHIFKDIYKYYPWLISMTASEASQNLEQYSQIDIYIEDKYDKKIGYINNFGGEVSFILRTNKKIGQVKGCNVEKIDDGIFHVRAKKEIFEIELR